MTNWDFFDNIPEYHTLSDANWLQDGYLKSKKSSPWKASTQQFNWHHLVQITKLQNELEAFRLHQPGAYKTLPGSEFTIHERGKVRPITGLSMRDRVVRHNLNDNILLPLVLKRIIYTNSASIKDRGIDFARRQLKYDLKNYYKKYGNDGWIMLLDVSKYYDNINHEVALEQFYHILGDDTFSKELLEYIFKTYEIDVSYMDKDEFDLVMTSIFNLNEHRKHEFDHTGEKMLNKSVLMGDQTSQLTGVFNLMPVDNFITIVEGNKYYGRYMDDSYVIAHDKEYLLQLFDKVAQQYAKLGLYLNRKKMQLCRLSSPFTFLQHKYTLADNGHVIIRIRAKSVQRQRKRMRKLAAQPHLSQADHEQLFKSWMTPRMPILSHTQLINLFDLYTRLHGEGLLPWMRTFIPSYCPMTPV